MLAAGYCTDGAFPESLGYLGSAFVGAGVEKFLEEYFGGHDKRLERKKSEYKMRAIEDGVAREDRKLARLEKMVCVLLHEQGTSRRVLEELRSELEDEGIDMDDIEENDEEPHSPAA